MTVLALRLSAYHNGVSKLHGHVSRDMWRFLWPDVPVEEVPIGDITNGIHTKTWLVAELKDLYDKYFGHDWREHIEDPAVWNAIDRIPDAELWTAHQTRKDKLVHFVRERVRQQYLRHGEGLQRVAAAGHLLNPNALTIGFARRFATYKRATLFFHDIERAKKILNNPERPVQIIFSGKAHPDDEPGKALIQRIYALSQLPEFVGKIVFVENYDMNIARYLISGVDLWLNTPRRPREASGTSGQKAALSGIPSFSVLDGWWAEGFDGINGWAIGEPRDYKDVETQDDADAYSLYTTLEQEIIPLFFAHDAAGLPTAWIRTMKNAIRTCAPQFSMRRMVIDYTTQDYLPAAKSGEIYTASAYQVAREMAAWKARMGDLWKNVRIAAGRLSDTGLIVGEPIRIEANVHLPDIDASNVAVEIVYGRPDSHGEFVQPQIIAMQRVGQEGNELHYQGQFVPAVSGRVAVGVRVRPTEANLINPFELGLMTWA